MVALLLLVEQVVGGRDMVVTVGLHAADSVILFPLEVFYKLVEEVFLPRHLL